MKKIEIIERITDANGSISENILTSWEHKNQFIPEIIRFGELKIYLQERIVKKNDSDVHLSKYEYDKSREAELKVLKFDAYSEEWLDFILNCRSGKDMTDYDLVLGGVANDKVFNTVELFFDGLIDKAEAINRLRYEKSNLQICFRTEKALSLLHFEGSERL